MTDNGKMIILIPPISMVSGSDVLCDKTEKHLQWNGIECELRHLWPDYFAKKLWYSKIPFSRRIFKYSIANYYRYKTLNHIDPKSVVWIQESAFPFDVKCSFEKKILEKNCLYIYHFKDDLFSMHDEMSSNQAKVRIPMANIVAVPTINLRNRTLKLFPSANVEVFEEPVDVDRLAPRKKPLSIHKSLPVVVWNGSPNNLKQLYLIKNVLKRVYKEQHFVLRVISGNARPKLDIGIPWEWMPYHFEREKELLDGGIIAIAPLEDNRLNSCKGIFKIKVYMASGIATVASPVGYCNDLIEKGETGYLPTSERDWEETLLFLLRNKKRAVKMGFNARKQAVERFSYNTIIPIWAKTIKQYMNFS